MGFPRQEYWSGLSFPASGSVPNPEMGLMSLAFPALAGGYFTSVPPGKPTMSSIIVYNKSVFLQATNFVGDLLKPQSEINISFHT